MQEGGYILIGQLLGVPAPLALSLSLVKRMPDLVLGAPGLLAWRIVEARHLLAARPRDCLTSRHRGRAEVGRRYSAGCFGFGLKKVRLRLSNSSILAPFLCMITLCCSTESELFQAQ